MKYPIGTKIRRKNHKKQKNRSNNHKTYTITGYSKSGEFNMVGLSDENNKISCMNILGLEFYEEVK